MRKLDIPPALEIEFATVTAIWHSTAETRRVDALVLSWVKYEKQLRRLFSFFIFQHPNFTPDKIDSVISAFAANSNLNPETFISGIKNLGLTSLPKLLGDTHTKLWPEIDRIRKYRNKIMHGQHTGQGLTSSQLENDVILLVTWISSLAQAAHDDYGYDGIRRNTYIAAKRNAKISVEKYPFSTPAELKKWLATLKK